MEELLARFSELPGYGIGGLIVILLYAIQSEVRFGPRARTARAGSADRYSTVVVSASSAVVILGWALAMKAGSAGYASILPGWFRAAALPGMPCTPWCGVFLGLLGIALRLWAVLTLRERYTRTLFIQPQHAVERSGPYRRMRHPGYLGSLLALNGAALTSGNWVTFAAALTATSAAYAYRIRVEDQMLVAAFGEPYASYRRQVRALIPLPRGQSQR